MMYLDHFRIHEERLTRSDDFLVSSMSPRMQNNKRIANVMGVHIGDFVVRLGSTMHLLHVLARERQKHYEKYTLVIHVCKRITMTNLVPTSQSK